MQAQSKKEKGCGKRDKSDKCCKTCDKSGHIKDNCWAPGGRKEGQGPSQDKEKEKWKAQGKKNEQSALQTWADDIFVFTCTSTFVGIADSLQLPSSKQGAIIDSGALLHFCPDKPKFINFKPLKGKIICTANDTVLYIHWIGEVAIELSNGSGKMKCILKETIYSPEMAFTLISAFCLDKAGCLTIFAKSQYTIKNSNGKVMPTLLY